MPDVSGVGISFGADRIYDVMTELSLFPETSSESTAVLFTNFGEREAKYCLPMLKSLRESGINAEIFPEAAKMKKQMKYADQKQIPVVIIVGEAEITSNLVTIKWMQKSEQQTIPKQELYQRILLSLDN
jgi:histidyl-tRNA synthetase